MVGNQIGKMFGKVAPGMCRMSMNGIAIKTSSGYKVYDVNTGKLVNCADFVFDVGDDIFFVFPTNNVVKGDIILVDGKPVCVINNSDGKIEVFKYEDSSIVTIVPESYIFFGTNYFYSKIVSIFGDMSGGVDINKLMPMMAMSEMMGGSGGKLSEMIPFAMAMNSGAFNFNNMFGGVFGSNNDANTDGGDK